VKAPITVRLDGDVLAWLKAQGGQYQTHFVAGKTAPYVG
jgi:uncharacterized protein (DUF4415 family)